MFTSLSFSGSEVFLGLAILALAIVGIIAVGRYRLARLSEGNLAAKHANDKQTSNIRGRNKYPEVDVLHNTGVFWKFGLVTVLAVAVMAFNWTLVEDRVEIPQGALEMEFDVEMEAPPQTTTPPPPPPPPPPVIEEVPSDALLLEEQQTFTDQSANADLAITDAPVAAPETKTVAPPPPPPPYHDEFLPFAPPFPGVITAFSNMDNIVVQSPCPVPPGLSPAFPLDPFDPPSPFL